MTLPAEIIYGYFEYHDSLAIDLRSELTGIADELATLQSATTVGAIRAALPSLNSARGIIDEDELAERTNDDVWDWEELDQVVDGDWPPMLTAGALRLFPADHEIWTDLQSIAGLRTETTTLNGDYVFIGADREGDLLAVLTKHGIVAVRDDDLIRRASRV